MGYVKRGLVCLLIVLLAACAGKEKKPSEPEVIVQDGEGVEKIVALPNPYLSVEGNPPKQAVSEFEAAIVAMQSEEWPLAQQQLEAMTQNYPELSGPWVNLGIVHWRQEQWDEAEQAFAKAIEVNALNNDAYVQYAVMQRERGKFPEAEQLYLQALQVWPHNLEALMNLGILYDMYMGRFDDALVQFELAQKLVTEPNRELDGWVIDLKRRQAQ